MTGEFELDDEVDAGGELQISERRKRYLRATRRQARRSLAEALEATAKLTLYAADWLTPVLTPVFDRPVGMASEAARTTTL